MIGVEYLYSQTGQTMTCPTDEDVEKFEDAESLPDEGIEDCDVDPTVVLVSSAFEPVEVPQSTDPSVSWIYVGLHKHSFIAFLYFIAQASVDTRNVSGFQAVQALADYLLTLRDCSCLTNAQADTIINLWSKLDLYDR